MQWEVHLLTHRDYPLENFRMHQDRYEVLDYVLDQATQIGKLVWVFRTLIRHP